MYCLGHRLQQMFWDIQAVKENEKTMVEALKNKGTYFGNPSKLDPNTVFINKPRLYRLYRLYRLIFSSKLVSAERFKDCVFRDVLPSVHKTRQYLLLKHVEIK